MTTPAPASRPDFSVRLDRRTVSVGGKSSRHLVVGIVAPATAVVPTDRLPIDLGVVIDASGSMQGANLAAAKQAAVGIIDALGAGDHLSLVSFADDVITHLGTTRMDAAGKAAARRAVEPIVTRGSTNLGEGWRQGGLHLATRQEQASDPERHQLILLSDGHANRGCIDPRTLAEWAGGLRSQGILTSTVGIGMGYSPVQLQAMAEAGGGRMHDAESPAEIVEIILAELGEALDTALEDLTISLALPAGVKAELHGTAPVTSRPGGFDIVLGAVRSAATRQVVVRLEFPAGRAGDRLVIEPEARWRLPGGEALESSRLQAVDVVFGTPGECERQPIDRAVATIAAEHWRASIYHRGIALNQDGHVEAARTWVEEQQRRFERYCGRVGGLEELVESLGIFHRSLRRRYDVLAAKEVLLATYKMGRGEADRRTLKRMAAEDYIRSQDEQDTER